ncbi:MAG TPA: 50S ribosomal protein L35ae [Candidatus Altiarchaeales archaeon]|nr:50S ribosomal protein L35ae [Candidatus Altiarchaeales archaeon]
MEAVISNYRSGARTQKPNQIVLEIEETKNKDDVKALLGRKVEWTTPGGNKINGEITRVHGNKGNVIAKFERGLPGQAFGTKVQIL